MLGIATDQTYPVAPVQIVVDDSKPFPGVVAPVCSAHQVLDDQANVDQSDLIVWG